MPLVVELCRRSAARRAALQSLLAGCVAAVGAPAWADAFYAGAFIGQGRAQSAIVDVNGASNWGNPGWTVDYEDDGVAGGILIGRQLTDGRFPLRVEASGAFGDLVAQTNRLDPRGRDETARSEPRWVASLRLGVAASRGPATFFVSAGPAVAGLLNAVEDLDRSGLDDPWHRDPDDSFENRDTAFGWAASAGVEINVGDAWRLRLEGAHFDFGSGKHTLNHSANNRCGPGNPRSPCVYTVDNELSMVRLAALRRFGR